MLALAPVLGIVASKLVLRTVGGGTSGSTSDEYVRAFHERHPTIAFRFLPAKLLAGVATIGSGGAVGLEGPSLYAGSSIGLFVHERLGRFFRRDEARLLLTAGAAAGVAAVFKTPATGVIFALEAPYRDDVTPQALLPSLIASAASYVTFVFLVGSTPVVPFLGEGPVDVNGAAAMLDVQIGDLLGALILGIAAGLGGRGFAWLVRQAKHATHTVSWPRRAAAAAVVMAGLAVLADVAFGEVLSLGPGTRAMEWVVQQDALELIALLFGIRVAATLATVLGDGVGGLFIPLATLGVIVGQFVGVALDAASTGLYATLGLAAFLGAGYRAPIAAVMFVAESTGAAAFVVPALVAAAVSQVVGGPVLGHRVPAIQAAGPSRAALHPAPQLDPHYRCADGPPRRHGVPSSCTCTSWAGASGVVPVVEGSSYQGMAQLSQLSSVNRDEWETTSVESMMTTDLPAGSPSWTVRDAVVAMEAADIEVLAVTDSAGNFIGVVTEDDVVRLGEILEETEG